MKRNCSEINFLVTPRPTCNIYSTDYTCNVCDVTFLIFNVLISFIDAHRFLGREIEIALSN